MKTRRGSVVFANYDTDADYKGKQQEAKHLLTSVGMALNKHAKKRDSNPEDWGYNGDLGKVISDLKEVLRFLESSPESGRNKVFPLIWTN